MSSSIFVNVIKDRYTTANEVAGRDSAGFGASNGREKFIRRPVRGIQIRDETFATIRLVANVDGRNLPLLDAGSRRVYPRGYTRKNSDGTVTELGGQPIEADGGRGTDIYSNFLLQQVSEERAEKIQVLETFGEPYIFMFGERPRMVTFQGILLNTFDFNWEAEWWHNYENYLRGTRCVELDARVFISYDHTLVSGYIIGANAGKSAPDPNSVSFSFQVFVTSYSTFTNLGDPNASPGFPVSGEAANDSSLDTRSQLVSNAAGLLSSPVLVDSTLSSTGVTNLSPSLMDSIQDNFSTVRDAWSSAGLYSSTVLSGGPSSVVNGDVLTVPSSFAGSMQLNQAEPIKLDPAQVGFSKTITYSVFSDNEDEYVGIGDHYGSSQLVFAPQPLDSVQNQIVYDQGLVDTVTTEWEDNGYTIAEDQLGQTARSLVSQYEGMFSASVLMTASQAVQAGSAAGPIATQLVHAAIPVE